LSACVVTGASRGIGRACALGLAERGQRLALLGRDSEALRATLRSCLEHGAKAVDFFEVDLVDPAHIERAASELLGRLGPPSILR
jgi:short-subunit dehydrogenase